MGATERLGRTWSEMQRTDEDEGAGIRLEIRDALRALPRERAGHAPRRRTAVSFLSLTLHLCERTVPSKTKPFFPSNV